MAEASEFQKLYEETVLTAPSIAGWSCRPTSCG
jgi:hypothetical protein